MNLGPYAVTSETLVSLAINAADSLRLNLLGVPRLPQATAAELARESLRRNAQGVLWAGSGHFHFMWVSDFAKALGGAWDVLGAEYLGRQIDWMTAESARLGRVTSCFSPRRGFDMPWYRGDNLPWLVHCHSERLRRSGQAPSAGQLKTLQALLDEYEATHLEDGLVSPRVTGDWVDTVLRPSSTYNNVCALHMFRLAPALGLRTGVDAGAFSARLLERRLRDDHFVDYAGAESLSVDAAVLALYLELFDSRVRGRLVDGLERSGLAEPLPIRCAAAEHDPAHLPPLTRWFTPGYHKAVWLHLGLMYLNGLRKAGRPYQESLRAVEAVFLRHGHVLEAVDESGEPYKTPFFSCERGLSMAAGQYLELAAG